MSFSVSMRFDPVSTRTAAVLGIPSSQKGPSTPYEWVRVLKWPWNAIDVLTVAVTLQNLRLLISWRQYQCKTRIWKERLANFQLTKGIKKNTYFLTFNTDIVTTYTAKNNIGLLPIYNSKSTKLDHGEIFGRHFRRGVGPSLRFTYKEEV
jgi:hypothetical protein